MSNDNAIEIIVRGVCVKNGKLLLCHTKGAHNTYLPGGHIECRESAKQSLGREIEEELGKKAKVGRFLGVIEHTFHCDKRRYCEINLLFDVKIMGIDSSTDPCSCEDYIEFWWTPMKKIADSKLEPSVLRRALVSWLKRKGIDPWGSTYKD